MKMKAGQQGHSASRMKIGELCERSGFKRSTIYRYIRVGMLHKPRIQGLSRSFYDETHLRKLKRIGRLIARRKLSFSEIKAVVQIKNQPEGNSHRGVESNKEQIIDKAIQLFSENGFVATRISDITDSLGVAKGTFYLHFKSKRDLLIDCIERMSVIVIPKEAWEDIRKETDYFCRQRKRLTAFLKAFPFLSGIVNLLRLSFASNDSVLAKKARDTYLILAHPLLKDLRWAIKHGVVRKVDEEIISLLMLATGETIGYLRQILASRYTLEELIEICMDFLSNGLLLSKTEAREKNETRGFSGDVTDHNGFKIRLHNIHLDERNYLYGNFGKGELRVYLEDIAQISLQRGDNLSSATVSTKNGKHVTLRIGENTSLSGESEFGQYIIPLKDVSHISLPVSDDASQNIDPMGKTVSINEKNLSRFSG